MHASPAPSEVAPAWRNYASILLCLYAWGACGDDIVRLYDPQNQTWRPPPQGNVFHYVFGYEPSYCSVRVLTTDRDANVLVLTQSADGRGAIWRTSDSGVDVVDELPEGCGAVSCLVDDTLGRLWIGTAMGLYCRRESGSWVVIREAQAIVSAWYGTQVGRRPTGKTAITPRNVSALAGDRRGWIWGLYPWHRAYRFFAIEPRWGDRGEFPRMHVRTRQMSYGSGKLSGGARYSYVTCSQTMRTSRNGSVFLAAPSFGVSLASAPPDGIGSSLRVRTPFKTRADEMIGRKLTAFLPGTDGTFWMAWRKGEGGGIMSVKDDVWQEHQEASRRIGPGYVTSAAEDRAGRLYFATYTNGVLVHDRGRWVMHPVRAALPRVQPNHAMRSVQWIRSKPKLAVTHVACDASGRLWSATAGGLLTCSDPVGLE